MNYKKLFKYGIFIWATAYIIASIFVGMGLVEALFAKLAILIAIGTITFYAAKNLKLKKAKDSLKYSAGWIIIGVLLDMVATIPFTGWAFFTQWNLWLGYLLIIMIPLLSTK
jgi:hypothetical protein